MNYNNNSMVAEDLDARVLDQFNNDERAEIIAAYLLYIDASRDAITRRREVN